MRKCQCCGTDNEKYMIMPHEMMGIDLCMRCTDKLLSVINGRDVNELWKDDDAKKHGLPPFELPSLYVLQYLRKRMNLMNTVMKLDYNFRKGLDL